MSNVIEVERPASELRSDRRARSLALAGAIGLVLAIGCLLRLWAIGRSAIDADSAVVGLMAHEILHGHTYAFFWGQTYGGVEPYVVALLFAIFGQSTFTLGLAPVLLDAAAALLVWRIGRRVFSPTIGLCGGLLFWIWPEVYVRQSTIEYGFRFSTLVCGLGLLLSALRISDAARQSSRMRRLDWMVFGTLSGIGFWASPEIIYYLFPALALLIWRGFQRHFEVRVLDVAGAWVAAGIGALPWLYDNVTSGFPSLARSAQPNASGSPFLHHLNVFVDHVLPIALGLRMRGKGQWLPSKLTGEALYATAIVLAVLFLFDLLSQRRALVIVAFLVSFPIFFSYSPFTWYWNDGRYALYLAPMLALFVAAGLDRARGLLASELQFVREARIPAVSFLVVFALAFTGMALVRLPPYHPVSFRPLGRSGWFTWQSDPTGFDARLASSLERIGIHDVYTGYWMAYPLAFESHGGLVATDVRYSRYAPYVSAVEHARQPAWLFLNPFHQPAAETLVGVSLFDPGCAVATDACLTPSDLEHWLNVRHLRYRTDALSYFLAVVPIKPVSANAVFASFNIPTRAKTVFAPRH